MDENKNLLKMRETYLTQLKKEKEKELLLSGKLIAARNCKLKLTF